VFIAATSAGKTVVAEYAIALSLKHITRCSSNKTLSLRNIKINFYISEQSTLHLLKPCLTKNSETLKLLSPMWGF
jgi:hypothetical protein